MMKQLSFLVIFIMLLVSCTPKGEEGGQCLEDHSCNNPTLVCTKDNKCEMCGSLLGEGCCPADPPWCFIGACNSEKLCVATYCPPGGECYSCGNLSNPCCENEQCMYSLACNAEGVCEYCGGKHQLPCFGSTCTGWLRLYGNICDNPFHQGDTISMEDCQLSPEGAAGGHSREWCFWYVAYNDESTSTCSFIHWDQMRSLCSQGENPDDYYTTLY